MTPETDRSAAVAALAEWLKIDPASAEWALDQLTAHPDLASRVAAAIRPEREEAELRARLLHEAMWNVLRSQDRGSSLFPEDSNAIAVEYARLQLAGPLALLTEAARAALAAPVAEGLDVELRHFLWANHGHGDSLYGDDGEMQCRACLPTWDYRRMPLVDVLTAARAAQIKRAARLSAAEEGTP